MSLQSPAAPDAGYGSLSLPRGSPGPLGSPPASASPSPTSLPASMTRLTMADVVGIDVAVAQAAQTLQQLQQQQAALYGGIGGLFPTHYYGTAEQQAMLQAAPAPHHQANQMLGSILASVQQPPRPGRQEAPRDPLALERAARLYRSAASVCEASCTWSGQLPPRSSTAGPDSSYSTKIFLGGVPWDISEQTLVQVASRQDDSFYSPACRPSPSSARCGWSGRGGTTPARPAATSTSSSRTSAT